MTSVAAQPIGAGPFEQPKKPFKFGTLYTKVWRAPFTHGLTDVWRRRCHEYWERVEHRFGIVVSEPRNAWADDPAIGPVVATYVTILAILPAERFPAQHRDDDEPQQVH